MTYRVDLQELEFQLFDWLKLDQLLLEERFEEWDPESVRMVLAEAVEFGINELASINSLGRSGGNSVERRGGKTTLIGQGCLGEVHRRRMAGVH